ncbi:hypothetical protein PABG_12315 [Paracoccidioides brasiliensis Pb03]|nr:hypothetical protein PABG_12315 [Paracoccidioides brasiliensis Pb03]
MTSMRGPKVHLKWNELRGASSLRIKIRQRNSSLQHHIGSSKDMRHSSSVTYMADLELAILPKEVEPSCRYVHGGRGRGPAFIGLTLLARRLATPFEN